MTMISSLVRFARRQLHTIVSREIIKPSFPTPSHLKTYNLSSFDQFAPDAYIPMVIFYPKLNILDMKNSLSQTLTKYYPFAGKLDITTPSFVDCNDDGVEFLESRNDKLLVDFLQNTSHEDLDQLFPNGQVWSNMHQTCHGNYDKASPFAIQINHFACGGLAVAVSLNHKIADATSLCNFLNDWAIVTRLNSRDQKYASPIEPNFISFKSTCLNYQGVSVDKSRDNSVTRSFVFPSSKLNDLKLKVKAAMTVESKQPNMNLTRLEVLNWLLYKCALRAATINNLGSFKPTGFILVANIRNKMIEPLPKTTIGNFFALPDFPTETPNEIRPSSFVNQLKKLKMEVEGIRNIEEAVDHIVLPNMSLETVTEEEQRKIDSFYTSSGLCNYPFYGIDFGWGKPIKVTFAGTMLNNSFVALDAPNGDGIEVFVTLGKQDMAIFQTDPELLSFC